MCVCVCACVCVGVRVRLKQCFDPRQEAFVLNDGNLMVDLGTALLEKSEDFKVDQLQVVKTIIDDFNKIISPSPAPSAAQTKMAFETTKLEETIGLVSK